MFGLFTRSGAFFGHRGLASRSVLGTAITSIQKNSQYSPAKTTAAPHGLFLGRHIISPHTRVLGGVYLGLFPRECVVLNEDGGILDRLYSTFRSKLRQDGEEYLFTEVLVFVQRCIKLDADRAAKLRAFYAAQDPPTLSLEVFVREGVGLARHQLLLAAYLMERLKDEKLILGGTLIETQFSATNAVHERLIYTSSVGKLLIFDPQMLEREKEIASG
jgi:hypothetical protein